MKVPWHSRWGCDWPVELWPCPRCKSTTAFSERSCESAQMGGAQYDPSDDSIVLPTRKTSGAELSMIAPDDYKNETVLAVTSLRAKCHACTKCAKQPEHSYEPGCRWIGCEAEECSGVATDDTLKRGFLAWNVKQRAASEGRASASR